MGADSFKVFFGLRFNINYQNKDEMEGLDNESDSRIKLAKKLKLEWFTGGSFEEDYHLFIGRTIGDFGREYNYHKEVDIRKLKESCNNVSRNVRKAGFKEKPMLHFQFFGDQ